ncbi:MAG: ribonuclease Z [Candidatus Aenigmatarchaeota archaeon]|nr:MAG: ribonuclease Z [Candidatus Aenigmarchaeota archaeon]
MIEIIFLGTGSSIPTLKRKHPAIWLRYENENILFDCGEGTQTQITMAKLPFMKLRRIFVTHWHADHWAGIIGLLLTMNMEKRKEPLYIYGPEADRFVSDILDLGYWGVGFRLIPKNVPYEGDEITELVKTDDFEITSTPAEHSVPAVAYSFKEHDRVNVDIKKAEKLYGLRQGPMVGKLKRHGKITFKGKNITLKDVGYTKRGSKVVYTGDTSPSENIIRLADSADVLIHESTFSEELVDRRHTSAKEAAEIAKKAKVKKLVMTHFSRRYTNEKELEEAARKTFKNSVAARDLMTIKI